MGKISSNIIIVGDLKYPLELMRRSSKQKIIKKAPKKTTKHQS
jgi:hypothetical protein